MYNNNNKESANKTPKVSKINLLANEFRASGNTPSSPFNPLSLGMKKVQSQKNQKMMINESSEKKIPQQEINVSNLIENSI